MSTLENGAHGRKQRRAQQKILRNQNESIPEQELIRLPDLVFSERPPGPKGRKQDRAVQARKNNPFITISPELKESIQTNNFFREQGTIEERTRRIQEENIQIRQSNRGIRASNDSQNQTNSAQELGFGETNGLDLSNEIISESARPVSNPKSTVTQEDTPTSEISRQPNWVVRPNSLSEFPAYTYYVRFFVTDPRVDTVDKLRNFDQVTLAETGSTANNLNNLEINNLISIGSDLTNYSTIPTTVSFEITEPLRNTFIDQLAQTARVFGTTKWTNLRYWLEIKFQGYTDGRLDINSPQAGGTIDNIIDGAAWYFPITVRHMDIDFNEHGSVYKFDAVNYGSLALTDEFARTTKKILIFGNTLGEAFESLAAQLNTQDWISTQKKDDTETPVGQTEVGNEQSLKSFQNKFYRIAVPNLSDNNTTSEYQNMENWVIDPDSEIGTQTRGLTTKESNTNTDERPPDAPVLSFPANSHIPSIIQRIIGTTREAQKLAIAGTLDSSIDVNDPEYNNQGREPKNSAKYFKVKPEVKLIDNNLFVNDFNYDITYQIERGQDFLAIASTNDHNNQRDKEKQREKIINLPIYKKYEYAFTGQNTEVIKYDINFNIGWHIQLPNFAAYDSWQVSALENASDVAQKVISAKTTRNILQRVSSGGGEKFAPLSESEIEALSDQGINEARNYGNIQNQRKEIENQLRKETDSDQRDRLRAQLDSLEVAQTNSQDRLAAQLQNSNLLNDLNDQSSSRRGFDESTTSRFGNVPRSTRLIDTPPLDGFQPSDRATNGIIFTGASRDRSGTLTRTQEFNNTQLSSLTSILGAGETIFGEDLPDLAKNSNVSRISDEIGLIADMTDYGNPHTSDNNHIAQTYYSSILNNIAGVGGTLQKLDMEIRGDPFWLGPPALGQNPETYAIEDLDIQGAYIIVRTISGDYPSGTLEGNDLETGYINVGETRQQGQELAYVVTHVTSKFDDGLFTQNIRGHLDYYIDSEDMQEFLQRKI